MRPMSSNLTSCLFLLKKTVNIYVSASAAPKLALVPESRYNCYVKSSYVNVCSMFH